MSKQKFRPPNETQGAGFRGPQGFPVPSDMKVNFGDEKEVDKEYDASIDSVLEDTITDLLDAKKTDLVKISQLPDFVEPKSPLDIVVRNIVDGMLGEGGAAVNGDRIPREHIASTIESFKSTVLSKIKYKSVKPIGSTGKKVSSGDLDLGLDTDLTLDQVAEIIKSLGLEFKANKGLGEVSIKFPQMDPEGKETGKFAQVDLMIGPEAWTQFQYYGPGDEESKYSGVHVRGIVNAIINVITGHSVSPARGIFRKDDPDKKYMQDPQHAVSLISKGSSEPWTVKDLSQPFEKIWDKTKRSFKPDELAKIKEYYLGFMKSTKREVPSELGEAAGDKPSDLPGGIAHLEDMKPDEFMRFLEKYKDLPLNGGLEVSEKVDGSARVSFGVENGKVWTQSKNGPKKTDASQYGDKSMFQALKAGHQALTSKEKEIVGAWPKDIAFLVAEVLYTKIPNSIEYGPNVIMVHGVHKADGSVVPESEGKKIVDAITSAAGGKLSDGKDEWKFEYKRIVNPEDVMVDVKEEFSSISEIYNELKKLEPNKLKAIGKVPYNASLKKFKDIQLALKKKLIGQLRKQKSVYGPEGGDVEGLVFRDLETGDMTKLVDKDYFTKLNNFLWNYRKMLDAGVKIGDKWEFGIMQKFRNAIADNVVGAPAAKMQSFVSTLKKFGTDIKYPPAANTPEKRADYLLSQYIKKNDLMKGDFVSGFKKELVSIRKEFDKLSAKWNSKKKGQLVHHVKDDEGNIIKTVKMDPIIKSRTDESFKGMEDFLNGVTKGLDQAQKMRGELTKRTALLKLMMGPGRFGKLAADQPEEELGEATSASHEAERSASGSGKRVQRTTDIVSKFREKLLARGVKLSDNPEHLGTGTKGTALALDDGNVLKVTEDENEALASNKIKMKGKKLNHVVNILDVFKFPGPEGLFGIVQEKLTPIPGSHTIQAAATGEAAELNKAFVKTFMYDALDAAPGPWEVVIKLILRIYKTKLTSIGADKGAQMQKDFAEGIRLLKQYKVNEMVDELFKSGIEFTDYHSANIMKRSDGTPVVTDLGYSDVHGGILPDVLEKDLKENIEGEQVAPILQMYVPKLKKRGINVKKIKILGSGWNGVAFDIGDQVLKMTEDQSEAKASMHIKGKELKHIGNIYDVFQFPEPNDTWYGILQENLTQLSTTEKTALTRAFNLVARFFNYSDMGAGQKNPDYVNFIWHTPWDELKKRVTKNVQNGGSEEVEAMLPKVFDTLEKAKIPDMFKELDKAGVKYGDVHVDNIMKRGSDYVVIDLGGASQSAGATPPILEDVVESVLEGLREGHADQVGVTLGRFQPFHRGHATIIRDLAKKFNKVIVIVAGNSKDKKNPFSFETRVDLMKKSLPDVMSKVEIHKAQFGGKGSGYIPGVISDIITNKQSTLDKDTAIQVLVGEDRVEDIKKQMAHALQTKEKEASSSPVVGATSQVYFDPSLATVGALPGVKNDDDADRISGTRVREALANDDEDSVKQMMDPHLVSNPAEFERLYIQMKKELAANQPTKKSSNVSTVGAQPVKEALGSHMSPADIEDILDDNQQALFNHRPRSIDVKRRRALGQGKDGVAYDVGGNIVLKVTTDTPEAVTSFGIKGKSLESIVHIYDVFRFDLEKQAPENPMGARRGNLSGPLYGIVTEKLIPLSQEEAKEFDESIAYAMDPDYKSITRSFIKQGDWPGLMNAIKTKVIPSAHKNEAQEEDSQSTKPARIRTTQPSSPFNKNYKAPDKLAPANNLLGNEDHDQLAKDVEETLTRFNLPGIMKDLKTAGIEFVDFHSGNIMKRGGKYVINDLGRSDSTSTAQPPKLKTEDVIVDVFQKLFEDAFTGLGRSGTGMKAGSSQWSTASKKGKNVDDQLYSKFSEPFHRGTANVVTDEPVIDEAGEQGNLGLSGIDKQKHTPVKENVWNPWTPATDTVPFDPANGKSSAGRGETKLAAELEIRGKKIGNIVGTQSYDLDVDGEKWEVKEYGPIRIEASGQAAAQKTLNFFMGFSEAIKDSLDEIDASGQKLGEVLKNHGMSEQEFRKFVEIALPSVNKGNIPLGLMGMTLSGEAKTPSDFSRIADTLHSLLKTQEDSKQKVKISIGSGEGAEQVDILNKDLDAADVRYLMKIVMKLSGEAQTKFLSNVATHIFLSNLKLNKIDKNQISGPGVKEIFNSAFDPAVILSDLDKIVIVHKEKGYFIIDPPNFLDYMRPTAISKSTQSLVPRAEKMGGKAPRVTAPKAARKLKPPDAKPSVPRDPQINLYTNKGGIETPNAQIAKKSKTTP